MKFLLVDGTNFLFRAFFAAGDFRAANGQPTGALLFLVNMLRKLRADWSPDYLLCVMDASGPTFRHELSSSYKANRAALNPELRAQIAPAKEFIDVMGWPLFCEAGVEADDVLATAAQQGAAQGWDVIVASSDKDLMQIVNGQIRVFDSMKNKIYDAAAVQDKFGVAPEQIADYLALCGDTADNIKGVEKVGAKTAAKLLTTYGNLDEIIAAQDKLKGVVRANFAAALASGDLATARQLTKIKTDVSLPTEVTDLKPRPVARAQWQKLCTQFQFTRLAGAYDSTTPSPAAAARAQLVTLSTPAELERHVKAAQAAALVAVDTETIGTTPMTAEMVGFSFCYDAGAAYYVPLEHNDLAATQIPRTKALELLAPLLAGAGTKVFYNGKDDLHIFANHGLTVNGVLEDTKVVMTLQAPAHPSSLSALAEFFLKIRALTFNDVVDGKNIKNFSEVAVPTAARYAAENAEVTYKVLPVALKGLTATERQIYEEIDRPLVRVLFDMERAGVALDTALLASLSAEWQKNIRALEDQATNLAGGKFNLNSPAQVAKILFEKMKAPPGRKTNKRGAFSTNEKTLQALAPEYPFAAVLLDHRGWAKLKGTYSDALPQMINPVTGRVHTNFNQTYVVTGRLASSNPNLQNIPVKTPEGRRLRTAFVAAPGHVLVSADYSQIELRMMAHVSQDEALVAAFNADQDVHTLTAAEVFSTPVADVSETQRRAAKAINFGLIYGMTPYGLSKALKISLAEARAYIEVYFTRYPGVAQYMGQVPAQVKQGHVSTILGRKITVENNAGALRAAINAPMQGSAADVVKKAMVDIAAWLHSAQMRTRMLLQVHDELIFEVPAEELSVVRAQLPILMEQVIPLRVPLKISLGYGANWGEAH